MTETPGNILDFRDAGFDDFFDVLTGQRDLDRDIAKGQFRQDIFAR